MLLDLKLMATEVLCPRCKQKTVFKTSNPFRPFCSERCKLIDLGSWAAEDYKIPAEDSPSYEDNEISANDPSSKS